MSSTIDFVIAALVTLASSTLLVTRLERVGQRLGLTQAMLGLVTALAANAPEITSAITALARGQREIGVSVVLGSNVFNLAALLGLGTIVAKKIDLHRRVLLIVGGVSTSVAVVSLGAVTKTLPIWLSLALMLTVFVPYVVLAARPDALGLLRVTNRVRSFLNETIQEEESEIAGAIHPKRGDGRDVSLAAVALVVVVLSSIVMEHSATSMGVRLGWSSIIIGGVVIAGVTSLPNAVAAVYFASRGQGAVLLSEALNSNNLNAIIGFMIPAAVVGLHSANSPALTVAYFYLGLTVGSLTLAYAGRGLRRWSGGVIIATYAVFVIVLAH